jgi:hypothetical protein
MVASSKHLPKVAEAIGEAKQVGSVPMAGRSSLRWKQHFKLQLSIIILAKGKSPYKPCYLGNITGSLLMFLMQLRKLMELSM